MPRLTSTKASCTNIRGHKTLENGISHLQLFHIVFQLDVFGKYVMLGSGGRLSGSLWGFPVLFHAIRNLVNLTQESLIHASYLFKLLLQNQVGMTEIVGYFKNVLIGVLLHAMMR